MFHSKATEHTFVSSAHEMFSREIICLVTVVNKFKRTEVILNIYSDHSSLKMKLIT